MWENIQFIDCQKHNLLIGKMRTLHVVVDGSSPCVCCRLGELGRWLIRFNNKVKWIVWRLTMVRVLVRFVGVSSCICVCDVNK